MGLVCPKGFSTNDDWTSLNGSCYVNLSLPHLFLHYFLWLDLVVLVSVLKYSLVMKQEERKAVKIKTCCM